MEVQVAPLQVSEGLLDRGVLVLDAHPGEGIPVGARRDQQEARILEADVALVEKMVDGGRQEQAVLAVQALLVVAVAPGLDVAADQVVGIGDSGDAALILDGPDVLLEDSLADAGGDEGLLFGFRELGAAGDLALEVVALGTNRGPESYGEMKNIEMSSDVERMIRLIRGRRVMLSNDLARLYEVAPGALLQAVKRNRHRFPDDFMFQLSRVEAESSRSQIVILKRGGNVKYLPYAFTEQGVAMLSSVLRSRKAINVNIAIMRVFVQLRGALSIHRTVLRKLIALEGKVRGHEDQLTILAEAIQELESLPDAPPKEIGFRA